MSKSIGDGSVFEVNSVAVAGLTKFGALDMSVDAVDSTDMESTCDEVVAGLMKTGEIPFEGYFDSADAGQTAVETAFLAKALVPVSVTTPNSVEISMAAALITKLKYGDVEKNGLIPFSGSIKPSGLPSINRTLSTGLTTPFFAVSGAGTLIVPAAAGNVYEYTVNIATGVASVTITPTAAAGTITITDDDGNSQVVATGNASTAIALGAAGSRTPVLIAVREAGKVPKVYTLDLVRAAA